MARKSKIEIFRLIQKKVKEATFSASAEMMNMNIRLFFATHPRGIGITSTLMNNIQISGKKSTDIITRFPVGYPAILELGPNGTKAGYTYPYDSEFGTFIAFSDEPNLKTWAEQNLALSSNATGLRVGRKESTFFGRQDNKWFTASSKRLKRDRQTKNKIIEKVRQIKLR